MLVIVFDLVVYVTVAHVVACLCLRFTLAFALARICACLVATSSLDHPVRVPTFTVVCPRACLTRLRHVRG